MMQLRGNLQKPKAESLIKRTQSDSAVDFSHRFPPVIFVVFVPFPTFSAGAMLPEGGAGALRCHEALRQSGGTDGTRQIHREPCVLVCGQHGQRLLEQHPAGYAEDI